MTSLLILAMMARSGDIKLDPPTAYIHCLSSSAEELEPSGKTPDEIANLVLKKCDDLVSPAAAFQTEDFMKNGAEAKRWLKLLKVDRDGYRLNQEKRLRSGGHQVAKGFVQIIRERQQPFDGPSIEGETLSAKVCSEICIMQKSQPELAEVMNNERPAWAITLFRDMEDYIACGEQSFSKDGPVNFGSFDEIDRKFDEAAVTCADERDVVSLLASRDFLADGTFSDSAEAITNIERVRAMAFSFAMVTKFGSTNRSGAAEKYAEARFPELFATTHDGRSRSRLSPAPAVAPPAEAALVPEASQAVGSDPHEGWNPLKPDPFIADSPADAMKWELQGHPESLEGDQKLDMHIQQIPGGILAVSVIREGLLDDSIAATWTYAELTPRDDGKWDVTMKGEKWRCARSGSDEWVITPCP